MFIDALSVYASVTATFVKPPAGKSLFAHVQYLRELLDSKVLLGIVWVNTRDTHADGLTKGVVDRQALHLMMSGSTTLQHAVQAWRPLKPDVSDRGPNIHTNKYGPDPASEVRL